MLDSWHKGIQHCFSAQLLNEMLDEVLNSFKFSPTHHSTFFLSNMRHECSNESNILSNIMLDEMLDLFSWALITHTFQPGETCKNRYEIKN